MKTCIDGAREESDDRLWAFKGLVRSYRRLRSDTKFKSLLYNSKHENGAVAGSQSVLCTLHFACGLGESRIHS